MNKAAEPGGNRRQGESELPDDLVLVATLRGAYGLRGWFRVATESPPSQSALLTVGRWWLCDLNGAFRPLSIQEARVHGDSIIARPAESLQREQIEAFKSWSIYLSRRDFPALQPGEYYWVDLIGCSVVNRPGERLGQVAAVVEHGAGPILVIEPDQNAVAPSSLAAQPAPDSALSQSRSRSRSQAQAQAQAQAQPSEAAQILIPFVPLYLDGVDLAGRCIRVDWTVDDER